MFRVIVTFSLVLLALIASRSNSLANNLSITNAGFDKAQQIVWFDLAWQNSWRVDASGEPRNWDAAWVFVKFRECGAATTTPWTHGRIDSSSVLNVFNNLEPYVDSGRQFYNDSLGVMLRRTTNGIFPSEPANRCTLRIANMPTSGSLDIKIFGIEMVHVPGGAYSLGTSGNYGFIKSPNAGWEPIPIPDENVTTVWNSNWGATSIERTMSSIPAAFPKGTLPFYIMKYEITQGMYVSFLNTIPTPAQLNRYPNAWNSYRHRIGNWGTPPNIYFTDREDRACNYLSKNDVLSYLDWSALRPLSELEYEKACRGPAPSVYNEFAWGTNTITTGTTISTSPENGTETVFSPAAANTSMNGSAAWSGGDGGVGPSRVGIYAKPTSNDRISTGATYYGIMDMSGNISEFYVQLTNGSNAGNSFNRTTFGDGALTTDGLYNVGIWAGRTWRYCGGSFIHGTTDMSTTVSGRSDRDGTDYTSRWYYRAGRGGR